MRTVVSQEYKSVVVAFWSPELKPLINLMRNFFYTPCVRVGFLQVLAYLAPPNPILHTLCSPNVLQIHRDPHQDKELIEDECDN